MLVFISDLHFADGTAGEHNIPPRAFDYFFQDLNAIVREKKNAIQEIKLVFLGDIFDLLRTWNWFGYPTAERPWGKPEKENALKVHTETIFDDITGHPDNKKSLKKIRDYAAGMQEKWPHLNPELIYVPGNHDRLADAFASVRQKVCDCLGLAHDPAQGFPHHRTFPAYGVFARHGHEFDVYNYEGGSTHSPADYQRVPIGDPITTELVSRLSFELHNRLAQTNLPPDEQKRIIKNFQEIDNVRPLAAVIEWLLYQVKEKPSWLVDAIEEAVDAVIRHFNNLEFVNAWYKRHDKWLDPFDKADQIQIALYILEKFKVFSLEKLFALATKAEGMHFKDELRHAAPDEPALLDPAVRYVVYGHTHEPLVAPMRVRSSREQIYLNTGTWRTRHQKSDRDASFVSWKNMTYAIFYQEEERPGREAHFETWTGTLKYA